MAPVTDEKTKGIKGQIDLLKNMWAAFSISWVVGFGLTLGLFTGIRLDNSIIEFSTYIRGLF